MYKVFVNDKPIILTSSLQKEENFPVYIFKNASINEILYRLKSDDLQGIYLYSTNLLNDWEVFCKNFRVITAAGGLVLNTDKEILFIYRGNKWDLPKGRIEKGESIEETAVREVEEECGITNLVLDRFLLKTYHIFYMDNETRLKETYWYLMKSDYQGELVPQEEEGITEVVFKNEEEIQKAFLNTYANIQMVYKAYLTK
ncbi:NUDIX hydrolase [Tenacibaculum sp. IB213877]|uniref:NUDIX hydrolase n=1 Tax=Tenacibaculum sp. IB213877 TaxID=3097351 RepID=UPI002A5A4C5F|nr:NUDIX hydrolase [Tenacibaculum sp. IB213877]MDY0781134.1 NUDIX hydrolase [Tenacibaculum sp. IB213877]